ncbi:MAG: hypothetical protein GC159_00840 [Phycisphaera sp.]|nr:hypothetical protein [Phycisphaera sp.]
MHRSARIIASHRIVALVAIASAMSATWRSATAAQVVEDHVDWPAFMARHDLVWATLPTKWQDGAFLGNGQLGLMIYQPSQPHGGSIFGFTHRKEEENALRLDLGRSDVLDHRGRDVLMERARLPIGHFLLMPVGKITGGDMRLDLWNAEARGTLVTDRGAIRWRAFIPAQLDAIVVEYDADEPERGCKWEYVAEISESPRVYRGKTDGYGKDRPQDKYPANPPAERSTQGSLQLARQPMLAGGDYTTAWKINNASPTQRRIVIAIGYNTQGSSADEAADAVARVEGASFDKIESDHRRWWHDYLQQSFVSLPDTRLESFYWIQMYKLGAATRADRPAIDLLGPWYRSTIWPGMWWNLNLQLTYYPVYTGNHLEIGASMTHMIDDNAQNLIDNAPRGKPTGGAFKGVDFDAFEGDMAWVARVTASGDLAGGMYKGQRGTVEMGNLPWAMHNYWRQCRYAADDTRMRDKMLPMLRAAINFYRPMLERDDAGTFHLRPTYSPELSYGPDCNYDLAVLRWGLRTLIAESKRLGVDDPLMPTWRDILAHLTDYPVDDNGFMVARGETFKGGHRHYSHLLMIYPLYQVNWDQPDKRELIQQSVDHWADGAKAFAGYSYSGAASMYASMGQGDKAAWYLNQMIDRSMTPNTMYMEADSPVIESPLSGAASVQDMLLQSWSTWQEDAESPSWVSTIRVFPGVPDAWSEVAFKDLRAENAFLVSAARHAGRTQWVAVKSLAGKPCRIKSGFDGAPVSADPAQTNEIHPLGDGVYELRLQRGETIVLHSGDTPVPSASVTAPEAPQAACNYFGSRAANAK